MCTSFLPLPTYLIDCVNPDPGIGPSGNIIVGDSAIPIPSVSQTVGGTLWRILPDRFEEGIRSMRSGIILAAAAAIEMMKRNGAHAHVSVWSHFPF